MAQKIFAKSLFLLMKICGWEQQAIAEHLGVSTSSCSLWATAKRPIAERHTMDFLNLVEGVIVTEQEQAGANSAHARELRAYVHAWDNEMFGRRETMVRAIKGCFETLSNPRARQDPWRIPKEDLLLYKSTAGVLESYLDFFLSAGKPVRSEGPVSKMTLVEYFREVRERYCGKIVSTED